jgi:hypothetical protein
MLLPDEYSGHSAFSAFHSVNTILIPQCERVKVITIKMYTTFQEDRHALTHYFKLHLIYLITGNNFKLLLLNFHQHVTDTHQEMKQILTAITYVIEIQKLKKHYTF